MSTIQSSVAAPANIYTTTVPLCQGGIENQICVSSATMTLPISVAIPTVVTHTLVQPTSSFTGTITVPSVTPTVTPISASMGVVPTCTPILTTTLVKPTAVSVGDRQANSGDGVQVLNKQRLQDLVREVDPNEQLDDDVEELLLQIADDFIENLVTTSCLLAKHRKSTTLETKDIQLSLEKNWNMWIPGFGAEEVQPYKKASSTEAHKQRLALIRKTLKKY
uniref:Transcription initiation factor TFIID subunit 12 n=1 Tax=Ornithodoros turicata TaxID=34597 RepID=A0A2R5LG91_9ACAR